MGLSGVVCQDGAVRLLRRAFMAGRVAHAYIFGGPEGVGKFKTAREWAALLLCAEPVGDQGDPGAIDSCGRCRSCRALEAGSHPDFSHVYKELIEFTRQGKNKKTPVDLPIDVIREFVIEKAWSRPTLSRRKVFIISESERLNASSQNCLLKVLEEPPDFCCIILLCSRLERLLPTIRSRCQAVRFGPVDEEVIFAKVSRMGAGEKHARYFGRLARGSLGLACRWAELELAGAGLFSSKKRLVEALAAVEFEQVPDLAAVLVEESRKLAGAWCDLERGTSKTDINRKAAKTIVEIAISAVDDAMKLRITPERPIINFDQRGSIELLARRFDTESLGAMVGDCYEVLSWIESSVNEKLIFERLLFSLAGSDRMAY